MGGRLGDIIVILIVALVLFGGNKLPEIGKALGSALAEFKKAINSPPETQPQQPTPSNQPMQPALAGATANPARRTRKSSSRRSRSKSSR